MINYDVITYYNYDLSTGNTICYYGTRGDLLVYTVNFLAIKSLLQTRHLFLL